MPRYSHRPVQLPGADPATDRYVVCDDKVLARITLLEFSPREGHWEVNLQWSRPEKGTFSASLDEALAFVRAAHEADIAAGRDSLRFLPDAETWGPRG